MKGDNLIRLLNDALQFDKRLRLLENLITTDRDEKMQLGPSKEKCKSCYSKIEFAQLFYILKDEGILFFDTANEKKNRSKFQIFLENNFSYLGDNSQQSKIKSISRQFSECKGYIYKDKQILFLEELITKMQERKNRLASW